MKLLKLAGLGIAIWGLSLVWPEVNLALTPAVMVGLVLGLGVAALFYDLSRHPGHSHHGNSAGQDHPSRPIPVTLAH
jgi:hypothetical protein